MNRGQRASALRSRAWRGVLLAGCLLAPLGCIHAAATPGPTLAVAPAPVPGSTPVSLHAWAKAIGGRVSWVVPNQKLRLNHGATEIIFEADRREIAVNGLRVFLGAAPQRGKRTLTVSPQDRDSLLVPLVQPQRFNRERARVIALDAGHGGKDKGTSSAALKILEKDVALDVVRRLQAVLESRGYEVVLTRADDTFVELGERPTRAARAGADLFLAVHFNATSVPTVHGIETYTLTPQHQRSTGSEQFTPDDAVAAPGNTWDPWNAILGYSIHAQLHGDLRPFDRGLKRARFVVIRDLATCPGVLIECGYLTNPDEAKVIATPEYRDRLARAIADGVEVYQRAVGRTTATPPPATASDSAGPGSSAGGGAIRARPTAPPG